MLNLLAIYSIWLSIHYLLGTFGHRLEYLLKLKTKHSILINFYRAL